MAKKKKEVVEETTTEETVVMEEPKVKTPKIEVEPKKPKWEIKDRLYYLKGRKQDLNGNNSYSLLDLCRKVATKLKRNIPL